MKIVSILIAIVVSWGVAADDLPHVGRRKPLTANVGVVSVGLDTYWRQCPGLLDDMVKKEDVFVRKCEAYQVKVSRFGMSDTPVAAKAMIPAMKAADLERNHYCKEVDVQLGSKWGQSLFAGEIS